MSAYEGDTRNQQESETETGPQLREIAVQGDQPSTSNRAADAPADQMQADQTQLQADVDRLRTATHGQGPDHLPTASEFAGEFMHEVADTTRHLAQSARSAISYLGQHLKEAAHVVQDPKEAASEMAGRIMHHEYGRGYAAPTHPPHKNNGGNGGAAAAAGRATATARQDDNKQMGSSSE